MELGRLFYTLALEGVDDVESDVNSTSSSFGRLGEAALKVGKVVATGLAAAGTAVGVLTKNAIDAYGDYEQLVGGVETLFKDSSDKVVQYAANAYKTAGMSANTYMETVTSFSASLLQGLGGDTEQAAIVANRAITDMSDNANKMGTDITSIQNAYQGFAKQNYTMLDNLKLGYGGTQEEMQRLIEDASKMTDVQEKLGITVDSSSMSFDNIVNAISVMQESMGIAGTTAAEASTTIQGSMSSMKSAWENLLVGLADDTQDFDALLKNFVDSAVTVVGNLLPRIQIIFNSIPKLIDGLVPQIPGMVQAILPGLLEGAIALMNGLVAALPAIIEVLVASLPLFVDGVMQIITGLISNLDAIIQPLVASLPEVIMAIVNGLLTNLPALIKGCVQLVVGLVAATPQIIASLISYIPSILQMVTSAIWESLPILIQGVIDMLVELEEGIDQVFQSIWNVIVTIWDSIKTTIINVVNGIKTTVSNVFDSMKTSISNTINGIKTTVSNVFNGVKTAITNPIETAKNTIKKIVDTIKGFFSGMKISFPSIKLPHFSIKPSGWKIGDLLKGSIPKLGIDWYAKGGILNKPTIFDYDPRTGNAKVGGEAGAEAVAPIETLLGYVRTAVAEQNSGLLYSVETLTSMLAEYLPLLLNKDNQLVLDTGVLVGQTANAMNIELGNIYSRNGRGG